MSTPVHNASGALEVFLEQMIDYAGLFPPSSLDMLTSINNYSRYLDGPQKWALGRFVLPVGRIDEFVNSQENAATDPWRLSGIVSPEKIEAELGAVDEFNRKAVGAVIDSVEVHVSSVDEIELVGKNRPSIISIFYEIAPEQADELLPHLRNSGSCAKLRTGGLIKEAIPTLDSTAAFIARCAEYGVPFKATAGLHHPLRSFHALTDDLNSPETMMHGFLNLFTAAAIAWTAVRSGVPIRSFALATCLADRERANWHFGDDSLTWGGDEKPIRIDLECIRSVRTKFALSFGSCSFEEPLRDLGEFGLL